MTEAARIHSLVALLLGNALKPVLSFFLELLRILLGRFENYVYLCAINILQNKKR